MKEEDSTSLENPYKKQLFEEEVKRRMRAGEGDQKFTFAFPEEKNQVTGQKSRHTKSRTKSAKARNGNDNDKLSVGAAPS